VIIKKRIDRTLRCGSLTSANNHRQGEYGMNKLNHLLTGICLTTLMLANSTVFAGDISGAGATFPQPIYIKWAESYKKLTGMGMNYQAVGSGNGIQQVQSGTVDFGATDAPLSPTELALAGLIQFPVMVGGVVPVINIPGIAPGQLKLNGEILADIYLGKIKKWNDRRIAADNADLALPDETIKVLYRSDASGTSYIFTGYLAQISPDWARDPGTGTTPHWPVGTGGKGNEGVASYVHRIKFSIGYVEYAYSLQNNLSFTQLKNRNGQFVKPDAASFKSAAANAKWSKDNGYHVTTTNEPGKDSWPITGVTYVLMQKSSTKPESAKEVLKFFDWAFSNGDKISTELNYVPLPANIQAMVRDSWKSEIKGAGGVPLWK
jgi:phosphate transport system substrate-binding protein